MPQDQRPLSTIYPVCHRLLPVALTGLDNPETLPQILADHPELIGRTPFLADLARIESVCFQLHQRPPLIPASVTTCTINPTLELIEVQWGRLPEFLGDQSLSPEPEPGMVLVYKHPHDHSVQIRTPGQDDLLALKIISEHLDSRILAAEHQVTPGQIDDIVYRGIQQGLLLAPPSTICRGPEFPHGTVTEPERFSAPTFTLQWHLTQTCDLHCRHCYDRSQRTEVSLDQGLRVLDDLYDFCRAHHVFTQVSFTGGNPLLHPHFNELYQAAADRGFMTAILGNPMPRAQIEEILAIQKPVFYQVSLEGLETHNNYIRGSGHFKRTLAFLELLKELQIYSMVMLTLTRANQGMVLELAGHLRGLVDRFTFNRLAMVGEGAALASAPTDDFSDFLEQYQEMAQSNPHMGLKDNLFNLLRSRQGLELTGGCAGYGCGAAFNFVSLLPDGEVHACRKFPSPMGNIFRENLAEIYDGPQAERYRSGPDECHDCDIRPLCGGCLAVSHGFGLDVFKKRDPYCFKDTGICPEPIRT